MTRAEFYDKLDKEDIFSNENFDVANETLIINHLKSNAVTFENCTFNCYSLEFRNIIEDSTELNFTNCTINCPIIFSDCTLESIEFENTQALKALTINRLTLINFSFSNASANEKPKLFTDFKILRTKFDYFAFERIEHLNGTFRFQGNETNLNGQVYFLNSTLTNTLFSRNKFSGFASFKRMFFKSTPQNLKPRGSAFEFPGFYKNEFSKVSFSESNFNDTFQFENCDFSSTIWFENCKNSNHSIIKFIACEFKGFSLFNKSKINYLDIDRCTFNKSSSFTDAEFNTLKLFEVKFGGGAYFDEMKINKVLDKSYLNDKSKILEWKRTLRAIKQESQKTENRIDFTRFRAYELAAHYEELNWKWNSGFIDKSILFLTKISTDYGNSWRKALRFIIVGGFSIYIALFTIENRNFLIDVSNWDNWARLFSGFFRFLLVTDFYNPLETDRVYLTNPLSWLIFIFGKIFIAFGIYEMVQSFRKFKA